MNWFRISQFKGDKPMPYQNPGQEKPGEPMASGTAINSLIQTVHMMYGRGAPTVYDAIGFNKPHYSHPYMQFLNMKQPGDEVPIRIVSWVIQALVIYKKRQIPNYDDLRQRVVNEVNAQSGSGQQAQIGGQLKVKHIGAGQYGKIEFYIPSLKSERGIKIAITNKMAQLFQAGDRRWAPGLNQFTNTTEFPVFKAFSRSKTRLEHYEIHPFFLPVVAAVLEGLKYDVSEMQQTQTPEPPIVRQPTQQPKLEEDEDNDDEAMPQQPIIHWQVRDALGETNGRWHMAIKFLKSKTYEGESLKQIMRYTFINWTKDVLDKDGDRTVRLEFIPNLGKEIPVETYVAGDYPQYVDFYTALRNRGYDTTKYVQLVQNLIAKGLIKKTKKKGELDGYASKEDFFAAVEKYESKAGFKLYPEQYEGVAFLYGRQSALLGDETGVGKTVQTIVAGDLRAARSQMQQSGGRSIVITRLGAIGQWIREIKKLTGNPDSVGEDPAQKRPWTVMYYEQFQVPTMRVGFTDEIIAQGKSGEITCLILDEIHSVKNGNPSNFDPSGQHKHKANHRTFNIQELAEHIPFVWGASATVVANKPIDVYNQLKVIGHRLGQMPFNRFGREFGGRVLKSVGGGRTVWVDGPVEQQIEATHRLKEALVDQGVYIQRKKKDIRQDMPEQHINNEMVPVDPALYSKIAKRMSRYKDSDLAISAMQAFRTEIAISKAPQTAKKALEVLSRGEKTAIFTDFTEPAESLVATIQQGLDTIAAAGGRGGKVVSIVGGMSKANRQSVIDSFRDLNSDSRCVVINFAAGGTGLDFPNIVQHVFNNDFDWSVALDEQALGRFYRINSEDDIRVLYLIMEGTEDEEFFKKLANKKKISEIVNQLTEQQMRLLLRGHRKGRSKKLEEVEKKLIEVQIKQIFVEDDKGFERRVGESILKKVQEQGNTPI